MTALVTIDNLRIEFQTRNGTVTAVEDVSFSVGKGETVGIVGESGSGKSVTTYGLLRILDRSGKIAEGSIEFSGIDIRRAKEGQMQELRGREMSMIFQNPRAALNPIRKIGRQIEDVLIQHAQALRVTAKTKAIELLELVKIRDAEQRYHAYPYELSGGMCQRVVIALALACQPRLLVADEPTTGLDVTTQKSVMDLIVELTELRKMSTILITHDLGLASAYCDRIIVMKDGKVIEQSDAKKIFLRQDHAYTKKLMKATPKPGDSIRDLLPADSSEEVTKEPPKSDAIPTPDKSPVLRVKGLTKTFPIANQALRSKLFSLGQGKKSAQEPESFVAVDDLSLEIGRGESIGLVGESGCGKSTTSAMVMRLLEPTSGAIELNGVDISRIPIKEFARSEYRPLLQMVFQDPTDSLNPRFTAERAISDPLYQLQKDFSQEQVRERVLELARLVGLPENLLERFPHQLSGGQKARVGIARAISLNPQLLILDEPTAALDVSVQAIVLNLLYELKSLLNMSYLFVSHDLNVVRLLCDKVIVMKQGQIIEQGDVEKIMTSPTDPYTRKLIEAIPQIPVSI